MNLSFTDSFLLRIWSNKTIERKESIYICIFFFLRDFLIEISRLHYSSKIETFFLSDLCVTSIQNRVDRNASNATPTIYCNSMQLSNA